MPRLSQLVPLLLLAAAACAKSDDKVSISGDVAGLDTLALRGDSLIAEANRPLRFDSLTPVAGGATAAAGTRAAAGDSSVAGGSRAGSLAPVDPAMLGANEMSRRAIARGDSMAKAAAQQLVGGLASGGRAAGDTLRGVVIVLGDAPARRAALRVGEVVMSLSGMATRDLARLDGKDVMIRGIKVAPRDIVVSEFIVRGAAGAPVYDGRLEQADGAWRLALSDGTGQKRITPMPSALRGFEGARVWIAMRDGAPPSAYGIVSR